MLKSKESESIVRKDISKGELGIAAKVAVAANKLPIQSNRAQEVNISCVLVF